jgi:hypothetical protein
MKRSRVQKLIVVIVFCCFEGSFKKLISSPYCLIRFANFWIAALGQRLTPFKN